MHFKLEFGQLFRVACTLQEEMAAQREYLSKQVEGYQEQLQEVERELRGLKTKLQQNVAEHGLYTYVGADDFDRLGELFPEYGAWFRDILCEDKLRMHNQAHASDTYLAQLITTRNMEDPVQSSALTNLCRIQRLLECNLQGDSHLACSIQSFYLSPQVYCQLETMLAVRRKLLQQEAMLKPCNAGRQRVVPSAEKSVNRKKRDSALIEAAKLGQLARVQQLVEQGASLDERDWYGKTALNYAIAAGQHAVVAVLAQALENKLRQRV